MTEHATFTGPQLPATLPDIDAIEAGFNRAVDLYDTAFGKIAEADAAIKLAYAAIENVTPGASFHHDRDAREIEEFHKAVQLPTREVYVRTARKLATLRCWHYVVDRCGMQQLMDAQAKKELDAQLRYVPDRVDRRGELITEDEAAKGAPAFTAENVRATLNRFAGEAGMIWRRGIANAFSQLDRRFRSHDGFKIGSRVILTYFADSSGHVRSYDRSAETFRDIERTFLILDGRDPRHARSDFLYQIGQERQRIGRGWDARQSEHENAYFKVRVYKNGNGHLWFTRDDLVELVNKELAAYYGETCRRVVDAIEIQPALATALRDSGRLNNVITGDFLMQIPRAIYDGVLMNPPFDRERDIDHVAHALKFLKEDGWLLAIMSAGTEFRETRKAAAFRKLLDERKGWLVDLPAGSFSEVGTHVNTVLVGFGMSRCYSL